MKGKKEKYIKMRSNQIGKRRKVTLEILPTNWLFPVHSQQTQK
jgi:hypothetical protein